MSVDETELDAKVAGAIQGFATAERVRNRGIQPRITHPTLSPQEAIDNLAESLVHFSEKHSSKLQAEIKDLGENGRVLLIEPQGKSFTLNAHVRGALGKLIDLGDRWLASSADEALPEFKELDQAVKAACTARASQGRSGRQQGR